MTTAARLLLALQRVEQLVANDVEARYAVTSIAKLAEVDPVELSLLWQRKVSAREAARAALALSPIDDDE